MERKLMINPIVRVAHYVLYFDVSTATASRMRQADRKILDKRFLQFSDFYFLYDVYPDKTFKPIYI